MNESQQECPRGQGNGMCCIVSDAARMGASAAAVPAAEARKCEGGTPAPLAVEASAMRIELGRCWLAAEQAGSLRPGSVIELDSGLDDSVEIFAGGRLLGRGQAVTVNGKVAVKLEETCPAGAQR